MAVTSLGVVVLCFESAEVIQPCLDSLSATEGVQLEVVLCDNDSSDGTLDAIREWSERNSTAVLELDAAQGDFPSEAGGRLTLVHCGRNLGFAGGVNLGVRALLSRPHIEYVWILNPDTTVAPGAALAYTREASKQQFALMGGRTLYSHPRGVVQSDGGRVGRWTGFCRNVNQGCEARESVPPPAESLDFISGANMVASRLFIERVGLMREDYFLYYEEVDWAFRRGDLPLVLCRDSVVEHHGGTSIGTGSVDRSPSAFANYYNFRNRMRFMRRFLPLALPTAYVYSMLKVCQLLLRGERSEAAGAFRGLHRLGPPARVGRSPAGLGVDA